MTSYAGGDRPFRVELAYGMLPSFSGVAQATIRALYGAACALVDLAPAVATFRDRQPVGWQTLWSLAAFARQASSSSLAWPFAGALLRARDRNTLLLTAVWLLAVLTFGILWDNSDDQFYFQLAVVFGALAGRVPVRKRVSVILLLSGFALFWNVVDLASRRILYPRHERLALLRTGLRDACLVVYPGHEDLAVLLTLSQSEPPVPRLSITTLAVNHPTKKATDLSAAIEACLAQDGPWRSSTSTIRRRTRTPGSSCAGSATSAPASLRPWNASRWRRSRGFLGRSRYVESALVSSDMYRHT